MVGIVQTRPSPEIPRHKVLKAQGQVIATVVVNQQPDEDWDEQRTGQRVAEKEHQALKVYII